MRTCFTIKLSPIRVAIADLSFVEKRWFVTRINVPILFRGKGIGSTLLTEIVEEADRYSVDLYLGISPSDGLDFNSLEDWYKRYGFVLCDNENDLYIRRHHSNEYHVK
jgi:predicted GNAT family N-acyltransferase